MWTIVADVLLTVLSFTAIFSLLVVRSYFSTYGGEKGKNVATHEDMERIIEDLRRATQATEEIKTQLSAEVWDRQREWELKREVMFETAKGMAAINSAIVSLDFSVKHL
ncbi:MAG TPA: hypothetical protein VNJ12_13160 [Candidatus Dormibacteraeota bacterium]|nr:hypothetical protein [Candidatus Dormibacteraeota bacterium]